MSSGRPSSSTYVRPLDERDPGVDVVCLHPDEVTSERLADGIEAAGDSTNVTAVTTVSSAFERLETEDIGCVVCDLAAGGPDGMAVLERLRAKHGDLPFVLVAENGSERVAADAVNAGADGYVAYEDEPGSGVFRTLADRIETVAETYRSHQRYEETTELLFRLTEYTTDTLWMFTADWSETVIVNSAYESVWDRTRADLIDDPADFLKGIHPDDRDAVTEKMSMLSSGEPADLEYRVRTDDDDDETCWVSVHAEPVFDEDGEVSHVAGFTRDISERREREQLEREANEHLETLVENIPVVVFTIDTEGVFTESVGAGLETLGLEPGDLEGANVFDTYAEYEELTDALERALDGEEVRVTLDIEETTFETWYRPIRDQSGHVTEVVGVSRDISELKRREQRLKELAETTRQLPQARSEAEVAEILVDIVDSIVGCPVTAYWSYDEETDRLEPLSASESALGVAGVETPRGLSDIERGHDEMERFEAGELSVVTEYGDLTNPSSPDADLQTLMLVPVGEHGLLNIGHPSRAEIDEFERTMVEMVEQTAIDALDRVERETELERRRTELERSNESLQQFAYVASHDLQEPLRMVSSYVSLLDSEYGDDLDDEAAQYMEYAVDGATRMQSMIDALLEYSRVHTQGEDFTEVDAGSVFDETLRSLELLVDDADVSVSRTELPAVSADRNQLGQLFQNLVKNAVHHGGEAPTVEVRAEREGAESDWVRFTVADDGPGIEPSQHDRIFEIFKQNSSRTDSTGIGLAMCKRIVERHGGDIWVESDPGDGAAFHFTMPVPDDDSQVTQE